MKKRNQDFIVFSLCGGLLSTMGYAQAENTLLTDLTNGDPFFYTSDQYVKPGDKMEAVMGAGRPSKTHSAIPHLPVYFGYMNTNSTYRFVNVAEQVFTLIGEGKHGIWRTQESGMIREYLKKGSIGVREGADLMAPESQKIISANYAAYLPDEGWSGYKYPDEKFAADGSLNYIDLPISHPKYQGKYAKHTPIDLPIWYCTFSESDYPYAQQAMNFAFAQPGANQIGPLGKRAGLDVKELYTQVLRLDHLPDARSWVNVGQPGKDNLHVKWEAVDSNKTKAEYYLVERPFFNHPFLFLTAIYHNPDNADHSYLRPEGAYFDSIKSAVKARKIKTVVTKQPRFWLENGKLAKSNGLPVYGVHHPNRLAYGAGGACPLKGGDWGRYPEVSGGSGWPTQYEEITPLCDAVLLDVKFFANLDGRTWHDASKYLANAGAGEKKVTYQMQSGKYGEFTDPYNKKHGFANPDAMDVPTALTLTYPSIQSPVGYNKPPKLAGIAGPVPTEGSTCRPVINKAFDDKGVMVK